MDIKNLTIKKYHEGLVKKDFSISEIISESLNNIKKDNKRLNVFLSIFEEEAKNKAEELDKIKITDKTPVLYGVPMAIKDNMLIDGTIMTAGSKILENYKSSYDATVIKKLKKQEAIFIGKTNLDEFAMGSSTENSAFGVTKNPYDDEKVAGGSSGGSAVAVSSNMSLGALGSDTGGSIREPASFCGVVGFKPTYGAVSRYGVAAMASSLDQIGPFAKTVEDAGYIFQAIAGQDKNDATSENKDWDNVTAYNEEKTKKITIGVPKEYFINGIDGYVSKEIESALDVFKNGGYSIKEISLPNTKFALSCYYIIMPAEVSANLGRYDGIRYGNIENSENLLDVYLKTRGTNFGEEVKRRILLGTFVLSSGYYDAYYSKAQKVRRKILDDFINVFNNPSNEGVDVIFAPVVPNTAFGVGEKVDDPLSMYLSDILTIPANLSGLPAISIPVRKYSDFSKEKMPVNFQLIGKHFQDADLFALGRWYENERN